MDFMCPRPPQGKNYFWTQVGERSGRSSRDSAGSEPAGKGTEEPVTFAGSRAGEHRGQPCLPAGRRAFARAVSVAIVPCQAKLGTWSSSTSGNQCRIHRIFS